MLLLQFWILQALIPYLRALAKALGETLHSVRREETQSSWCSRTGIPPNGTKQNHFLTRHAVENLPGPKIRMTPQHLHNNLKFTQQAKIFQIECVIFCNSWPLTPQGVPEQLRVHHARMKSISHHTETLCSTSTIQLIGKEQVGQFGLAVRTPRCVPEIQANAKLPVDSWTWKNDTTLVWVTFIVAVPCLWSSSTDYSYQIWTYSYLRFGLNSRSKLRCYSAADVPTSSTV